MAKHLGYNSLNGRALAKIGAVRAYGLIEGSGDDLRISTEAIVVLNAPQGSDDRERALSTLAVKPSLFSEIRAEFPDRHPSEDNLRYWLTTQNFTPEAAGRAASTYLETMRLVGDSSEGYVPDLTQEPQREPQMPSLESARQGQVGGDISSNDAKAAPGYRREVITLDEGDVAITFPENLSNDSFEDLKGHLELFVKKMQRRARSLN
jgi:hypothetical protein